MKRIPVYWITAILLGSVFTIQAQQNKLSFRNTLGLEGVWKFKLDPFETGVNSNGVQLLPPLAETITLPGSTDQAGKGYKTQGMTSLRLTRAFEYKGIAWYEKEIEVPEQWKDKEVELFLERAHWQTDVWINDKPAGKRESLSVPHRYMITSLLRPGKKNKIRIRVNNDKIYDIEYAHAISAETQTNWNGIIGKIELRAFDRVHIADVQAYPDAAKGTVRLLVSICNTTGKSVQGSIQCNGAVVHTAKPQSVPEKEIRFSGADFLITVTTEIPLGTPVQLWDEFDPALYRLQLTLNATGKDHRYNDATTVTFGVRELTTQGTRFVFNGRPAFIRGTVNSSEFPLTGYPPTDKKEWIRIFTTCKDYGLNAMRFHTWCPPEAAFEAADELGFYLQVENPDWRFTVGKDSAVNGFLRREGERILNAYGNHPSFIMFCEGNELVGPTVKEFLTAQVTHWKQMDPRRLYTGSAAYPLIDANDYHVLYGARPHRWKEGLKSRFNVKALDTWYDYSDYVIKNKVPMITHEVGQWCVYPDFNEIPKYTGVLKPYNYELFRELLRERNMLDQAEDFMMASGKFQVILKKEEVESYLRTPGLGGYHMLQLNDFPGQGTAPVGVVDIFWDPKPYVTAAAFHKFQNTRVPLLRTASFTWTNAQTFTATAQFANFDSAVLKGTVGEWRLCFPDGKVYASGSFAPADIPVGSPFTLGEISVPLDKIETATQLKLTINIRSTSYSNDWNLWVYPQKQEAEADPGKVLVADSWNKRVATVLEKGGSVLLLADTAKLRSDVAPGFSGISWNTVWSGMPPNLLGILCDPEHPALQFFPTAFHSDWQWWDLVAHSKPVVLDHFPFGFKPLVQMIPDWNNPRKISLVFEARVGKGKLLVTAIDLKHQMEQRPVARQLLYSLKRYVSSNAFAPTEEVPPALLQQLFKK
ncbi:glycoside hydrolase family 2 [Niabella ginsenosidivorans]|uniref:Glycoside hydrolase family 2 n=2 Tax=Niabella ginsenosidivorans TaxID=1176587 RepID=A0A1A9I226_9BACT|nr:glycoside hydrolase family 2 [Niabella ginsenosidivorans]